MTDAERRRVAALVAKWRRNAESVRVLSPLAAVALLDCADQLEALLENGDPPAVSSPPTRAA